MTREEELARSGWKKLGVYDEPRLSELVSMYEEIGFEVKIEPTLLEEMSGCNKCMEQNLIQYKTLYTRKMQDQSEAF